jgi:hypothetical protein
MGGKNVTADGQEMLVRLHRKRLEPVLVEMSGTDTTPVGMPALRVRQSEPADKRDRLLCCSGPPTCGLSILVSCRQTMMRSSKMYEENGS